MGGQDLGGALRLLACVGCFSLAVGCGGSTEGDPAEVGATPDAGSPGIGCEPAFITGSPFGHSGTSVLRGGAVIDTQFGDGLDLQLLLRGEVFVDGVLPEDPNDLHRTCGDTFTFEVTGIDAGTYFVELEINEPGSDLSGPAVFRGAAIDEVTLVVDETLTVDLTFAGGL